MIKWREDQHESKDMDALHDPHTIEALKNYELLKFYKTQGMRKQVLLLECLINMWDANDQAFHVDPHILNVEVEDLYFLRELSKSGYWIMLVGHLVTDLSTDEYMGRAE